MATTPFDPNIPAPQTVGDDESVTILVDASDGSVQFVDGALKVGNDDGSVTIDLNPGPNPLDPDAKKKDAKFDSNLAELLSDDELGHIGSELLRAIETDDQTREEWLQTRAKGIDMLGFRIEEPRSDIGSSTAPLEGMSTVRHPILTEAVIRFQSNASAELLPAQGPVKVRDDSTPPPEPPPPPAAPDPSGAMSPMGHNGGPPLDDTSAPNIAPPAGVGDRNVLAEALEKDFNHYLTAVDRGYRADTDRMLFWVGFGGCGFKKVYNDPIRRMPISRSVDAADLIVSNAAHDIEDAGRITHRILMRPSQLRRMQLAGVYRDINLLSTQPTYAPDAVEKKEAAIQGFQATPQRPEDHPFTVYETYVELNIKGYEHKDKAGKITGLALPYRVTIEKDSRHILEIRRNWREDDDNQLAKKCFVKYPFVPTFGFYEIGLLHILGNAARALTGAWRLILDAGMFSSFPGFLYSSAAGRQSTNQFRVPPGGGVKIEVPANRSIQETIMPLPYKEPSAALLQMGQWAEQTAQRVGGTAELMVGEGKQDAPVGTTLALIEQATKMLAAVHVRLHAAQSEEFQLLKDLFREDPEALWRHNKKPAAKWEVAQFLQALDDYDLVPAADPNTPSHMHRIMKAVAIKQLQMANQQLYDGKAVDSLILHMIGINEPYKLFAPPPPAAGPPAIPPDPNKMAELQQRDKEHQAEQQDKTQQRAAEAADADKEHQARMAELAAENQDRTADRQSREKVAGMHLQEQHDKDRAELAIRGQEHAQQLQHAEQQHQQQMQHDTASHAMQADQHQQQSQQRQEQHQQAMQKPPPAAGGPQGPPGGGGQPRVI